MSRPVWMDRYHEFREDIEDGSMCLCGIPALVHDEWESRFDVIARARRFAEAFDVSGNRGRAEVRAVISELITEVEKLRGVLIDGAVDGYKREHNLA